MKKLANIILLVFAICLSACQNNGDIGDLYGTWRLDSYAVDGVEQAGFEVENTTFSFQNNVVYVVTLKDEHQSHYEQYGTWKDDGNTFTFNFTHSDNQTSAGEDVYAAPSWLGMTSAEPMVMDVEKRSSSDMVFHWVSPDGAIRVYKLHKTL